MKETRKPRVKLIGEDGNAFAVLAKVSKALKEAGFYQQSKKYREEAIIAGDYNHLLQVTMRYVEIE